LLAFAAVVVLAAAVPAWAVPGGAASKLEVLSQPPTSIEPARPTAAPPPKAEVLTAPPVPAESIPPKPTASAATDSEPAPSAAASEEKTDPAQAAQAAADEAKVKGDTAWMLISSALVMLMIPGLALFYAGMVRRKNVLATMMQSMVALAVVGVYWVAVGYALAFGESHGGWIGWSNKLLFLQGVEPSELLPGTNIPVYVHVMFQGMFAIITPALISGALAERIRFGPYCLFLILWVTVVYCPLAHWVWAMDWWQAVDAAKGPGMTAVGWLGAMGALDFAGGTVVHIAAGFSALAAILVLRKRLGYPEHAIHPNSMVLTVTGAGLLWFGWFGFNGGSAVASGSLAASAFTATQIAAAAAGLSWLLAEWVHKGKPTALGLASGIVAGLVAVTPASGFVYPWGGLIIGLAAGVVCYAAVCLKPLLRYDDSLDAFGVHGVGGFLGAVLTGVFCYPAINAVVADGLFATGSTAQVVTQLIAAAAAAAVAFAVSLVLVKAIDLAVGFTTDAESETIGLDRTEHGEVGFDFGPGLEVGTTTAAVEPKPASVPPDGQRRFSVVVEGVDPNALVRTWSELCKPGTQPPPAEFKAVYPYLTTVQGNRFRFRGGEPQLMKDNLERLLKSQLKTSNAAGLRARVEA
jgi:ammonium transporter